MLAAEYRALRSYAELQRGHGAPASATRVDLQADRIERVIETQGWNEQAHHFYGFLRSNSAGFGSGDLFVLYFGAITDAAKRKAAVTELKRLNQLAA